MDKVPMKATDPCDLERNIMDTNIAKSESGWWAYHEITKLHKELAEANDRYADLMRISQQRVVEREAECLKLREVIKGAWLDGYCHCGSEGFTPEQQALYDVLTTPPVTSYLEVWEKSKYGEPVAFTVLEGSDGYGYIASWIEACHEHINEAINEHAVEGASNWKVVPLYSRKD